MWALLLSVVGNYIQMSHIHINIGSNQNRRKNISQALDVLRLNFFDVVCSDIFESNAIGFEGANFYNMGVNATTDLSVVDVLSVLHTIENNQGRDRSQPKFSSREVDLDLVLYDEVIDEANNLPRSDILTYNFVLLPLAQLNPQSIHPLENKTYAQLSATVEQLKSYNIKILNKE